MSIEAGRSQWCGVGLGGAVDVGPAVREELHDGAVAGCGRAPERGCALYRLPVEGDGSRLLHICGAPLYEVLYHLLVAVAAAEDEGCGAVGLGCHQLGDFILGSMVKEYLK